MANKTNEKNVMTALNEIQKNKVLARKFSSDPDAVLKSLGVSTEKLQISKGFKRTSKRPVVFSPGVSTGLTICGSIGYIVCASVGGEVNL